MAVIQTLDGKVYDLDQVEIRTRDFIVSSPVPIHNFKKQEGARGVLDFGTSYDSKEIEVEFLAKSKGFQTFSLLRDEIFDIFHSEEPFYLIEKRISGKRWLVKTKDKFKIPQRNYIGEFDATFIVMSGVAESVLTTQDIHKNGILNNDCWSFGMGLETVDNRELIYTHNAGSFKIFNAGNVEVHPFTDYLKIGIKNVVGSTNNFSLLNITNSSRFNITKQVPTTDVWIIDGPVVTRNSLFASSSTTNEFIFLDRGWNTFQIYGATSAEVSFDFNFLYK